MKIIFKPFKAEAGLSGHGPLPAMRGLPEWFSKIPRFTDNGKKFKLFGNGNLNSTVKWCNPFFDSLTAGYVLTLEYDLFVDIADDGEHSFSWRKGGDDFISMHNKTQTSPQMVPYGFDPQPYKFHNPWSIKTPKGYSVLFMHPLNRSDLPFQSVSGFVDNDDYSLPVHFPFFIKADFQGIIPAGTPIIQMIPIKRESWRHEKTKFDSDLVLKEEAKFLGVIYRAYKNLVWKRKDYR